MIYPARTVFLVGNGAVLNGWNPVKRALGRRFRHVPDSDLNLPFAVTVFNLRWLAIQRHEPSGMTQRRLRAAQRVELANLLMLKRDIARELRLAQDSCEISVRPELYTVLSRFAKGTWILATTNWDQSIEASGLPVPKVLHLHGDVSDPETLYLPTELTEEPYRPRTRARKHLVDQLGYAIDAVAKAERIVVYGLSLTSLDVEVGRALSAARHGEPHLKEAVVVDPKADDVADRLRFFIPGVKIRRFTPDQIRTSRKPHGLAAGG
jgi:hypothetical protein